MSVQGKARLQNPTLVTAERRRQSDGPRGPSDTAHLGDVHRPSLPPVHSFASSPASKAVAVPALVIDDSSSSTTVPLAAKKRDGVIFRSLPPQ